MIILESYQDQICIVESMDNLYLDSHGIWRDKNKGPCDLVGVWMPKEMLEQPVQLSLF